MLVGERLCGAVTWLLDSVVAWLLDSVDNACMSMDYGMWESVVAGMGLVAGRRRGIGAVVRDCPHNCVVRARSCGSSGLGPCIAYYALRLDATPGFGAVPPTYGDSPFCWIRRVCTDGEQKKKQQKLSSLSF